MAKMLRQQHPSTRRSLCTYSNDPLTVRWQSGNNDDSDDQGAEGSMRPHKNLVPSMSKGIILRWQQKDQDGSDGKEAAMAS